MGDLFRHDAWSEVPLHVVRYFEDEVIGGPDAFVEPVRHLGDYAGAIRRKLQHEIEAPAYSAVPGRNIQASIIAASGVGALAADLYRVGSNSSSRARTIGVVVKLSTTTALTPGPNI